jgi:hypothetical protein
MGSRSLTITEHFDEGHVTFRDGAIMGLLNVSEEWSAMSKTESRDHLNEFIDKCLRGLESPIPTSIDPSSLRIVLYPCDFIANKDPFLRKGLCDSFYAQIMIDLEDSARAMCTADLELVGLTETVAFETASENNWRLEPNNVDRATIKDAGQLTVVYGDSMYTAAQVLHLDRFVIPVCEKGVVLSVPHRSFFAFARADEPNLEKTVQFLATLAIKESSADYPVTSDLVWWKDGVFTRIGGFNNDRYEVNLPTDLKP